MFLSANILYFIHRGTMKNHGSVVAFTMPEPETELSEICKMISDLAIQYPDILEMIRRDQERHGRRPHETVHCPMKLAVKKSPVPSLFVSHRAVLLCGLARA